MISIIYAGNQSGTCYGIFKLLTQKLENKEKHIFSIYNLLKKTYLFLEKGYKHELTDKQNKFINIKSKVTLIFIYPLYWLNMPMLLKDLLI